MTRHPLPRKSASSTTPIPTSLRPRIVLLGGAILSFGESAQINLERKAAGLLAYLALEGKTPRSRLAALLWPGVEENTARNNLAQTLRRLRQIAGNHSLVEGLAQIQLTESVVIDLRRIDLVRQTGLDAQMAANYGEILAGLAYDDCPDFDDWLQLQQDRLISTRLAALEALSDAAEAASDFRTALGYASRLLFSDPYCEAQHRRVIRLFWLMGDRNAALAAYRRCRESLQKELGIEPSAETLALERSILRGEAAPRGLRAASRPLPPALLRPPCLVEREKLLARMEAASEKGQAIFVEGPPGIGKTRLMQEFFGSRGRYYTFQCRPGDADVPYASIARQFREMLKAFPSINLPAWVREELARILPELGGSSRLPLPQCEQLHFFQALAQATELAVEAGMHRVAFDDLHLEDVASINVTHFVCAQHWERGDGMSMVFCFRRGELAPQAEALLTTALERDRAILVRLEALTEAGMTDMLAGIDPALAPLAGDLHRYTGGNPFFTLETLRAMHGAGSQLGCLVPPSSFSFAMPRTVRDILVQRLARLSPHAIQLARLLALADGRFKPAMAEKLLNLSCYEVASVFLELANANILIDRRFANEFARHAILDGMPESVQKRLADGLAVYLRTDG